MHPHLSPDKFSNGDFSVTGRLRPGMTTQRADQELAAVAARHDETRPEPQSRLRLDGVSVAEVRFHPDLDGVAGALGMAASLGLGVLVERFLIGVGAFDAVALVAAPVLLASVAPAAAWLPARKVGTMDPVQALRSE